MNIFLLLIVYQHPANPSKHNYNSLETENKSLFTKALENMEFEIHSLVTNC